MPGGKCSRFMGPYIPCGHAQTMWSCLCSKNKSGTIYVGWLPWQQTTSTTTTPTWLPWSTTMTTTDHHQHHHNLWTRMGNGCHHTYTLQWCPHHLASTNESKQCTQTMLIIIWAVDRFTYIHSFHFHTNIFIFLGFYSFDNNNSDHHPPSGHVTHHHPPCGHVTHYHAPCGHITLYFSVPPPIPAGPPRTLQDCKPKF